MEKKMENEMETGTSHFHLEADGIKHPAGSICRRDGHACHTDHTCTLDVWKWGFIGLYRGYIGVR